MLTIPTTTLLNLNQAIQSLDAKEYRLPGKARYALARSLTHIKSAVEAFEKTRTSLFREHFGEVEQVDNDHPKLVEYKRALQDVLDTPVEVQVHQMESGLLEDTDLPVSVLSLLLAHLVVA